MSNILFLIPKDFEFRLLSLLNESSFKIEKIFYEKKPTELPETPKFDLIIFALVKEVDWLSITLSRFRCFDLYTPILIARPESLNAIDKSCLSGGADSTIDISCSEVCLLHKIGSLINRTFLKSHKQYIFGSESVLDSYSHCLYRSGKKIHLGTQQFKIIEFLASNAGSYFTTFQILERIGIPSDSAAQSSMRMQIMKLRKILGKPGTMPVITTKYGLGYCIENVRIETM